MIYSVTYTITSALSAMAGDYAETGTIGEFNSLREAFDAVQETRTSQVAGVECIEADSWPISPTYPPRYITVNNGMEFITGDNESRSLHIPDNVTGSSACRIARLLEA